MSFDFDPDLVRSASHRSMVAHLCGPLAAGAVDSSIPVTAEGLVEVSGTTREPLLLAAPKRTLDGIGLRVHAVLDPAGANLRLGPALEFAPYTESGAFLPWHRPPVDPVTRTAAPFIVQLTLEFVDQDGLSLDMAAGDLSEHVEVRLLEGIMGRLLYLLASEKPRIRQQAREIAAVRHLSQARLDALDRFGADLGVPRFFDQLRYDVELQEIVSEVRRDESGVPVAEPDDEYRRRLSLYLPFLMPARRNVLRLLNGPGTDADPNQGALGELGVGSRFRIIEQNNQLAFAVQLIASEPQLRTNFLDYVRGTFLVWPADSAEANDVHAKRVLSSTTRGMVDAVRVSLRASFAFGPTMAVAPLLAAALERVGRCRRALGVTTTITVTRAQELAGSRYELGLGVDIESPASHELDDMRTRVLDGGRAPAPDAEIEALLRALAPKPSAEDPEGRWLLEACGLRTVHRVNAGTVYVSHLPTLGLAITQPQPPGPHGEVALEARYHAPGDPGKHAFLATALQAVADKWTADGGEDFSLLPDAQAGAAWDQMIAPPAPAQNIFAAAGLPLGTVKENVVPPLKALPPELIETIQLGPALSQRVLAGDIAAADELRRLAALLKGESLSAVLPLVTAANRVVLVTAVVGLPQAGINLSARRATGFRWYVVPIQGAGGEIKTLGSRTTYVPKGAGLSAVVVIGYARRGLADPYEFRVELSDGDLLNLLQYEFLMNLLENVCPIGIEINTFSVREGHVDLIGDGAAIPLPPVVARTYRRFFRPRHRGEVGVDIGS